jgi:hypothetical protein
MSRRALLFGSLIAMCSMAMSIVAPAASAMDTSSKASLNATDPAVSHTQAPSQEPGAVSSALQQFVRSHRQGANAGAHSATRPFAAIPNATLCLNHSYSDPYGDAGLQDADAYAIGYNCSTKVWSVVAHDPTGASAIFMGDFTMFIDRDRNPATGCQGAEVGVIAYWDDSIAGLATGAVNTPDCTQSHWSVRSETITVGFPDSDTVGLAFPNSVINASTFNWKLVWSDLNNTADIMPNTGWQTTTTPTTVPAHVMQFGRIQYDSPGTDTGTNTSLNGEYVTVKNYGTTTKNLKGWTIRDAQSHIYTFSTIFNLAPNAAVNVHTGKGTNTGTDRYWGSTGYIWNNAGDTATLKNASGTTTDTCAWSSVGAGYKICPT